VTENILSYIRSTAHKKIIFTEHALDEMNKGQKIITVSEVKQVIMNGFILEDYPEDKRGHSCLLFGYSQLNRPIHVVCSPKSEYLGIITVYIPAQDKWESDFKTRRRR
jgi:hypothetical protein